MKGAVDSEPAIDQVRQSDPGDPQQGDRGQADIAQQRESLADMGRRRLSGAHIGGLDDRASDHDAAGEQD